MGTEVDVKAGADVGEGDGWVIVDTGVEPGVSVVVATGIAVEVNAGG